MYDLNALKIFVKVVENDGFTAASKQLNMAKSKISRIITKLESDLGNRLLERTTRQIRLTEAGALLLDYAKRIIEEAELAESALEAMHEQVKGQLRISASLSIGQILLGHHLHTFHQSYPDVHIDLVLSNRRVDLIEENFDLAIRIGRLNDSSLVAKRLGVTRTGFYASDQFLSAHTRPKSLKDLSSLPMLCMSQATNNNHLNINNQNGQKEKIKLNKTIQVNDFNTIKNLALTGIGIAMLPQFMVNESSKLNHLLSNHHLAEIPIYAVYPSHRGATPKLKAFIQFLSEEISPLLV